MYKTIYGADSETIKGKPMSLQFYSEDIACNDIFFVNEKTACKTFLKWCGSRARDTSHVLYVHNLSFDLVEFIFGNHEELGTKDGAFDFHIGKWHLKGVYGTPTFCTVSDGHRRIEIYDTYSYFRGSLAKGAELFCPDLPKLEHPDGLGEKLFTAKDSAFVDYAMRDAVVTYHMGRAIEKLHQQYDIRQCVSVADMASTIFRHKFLTYTIPQPTRDIIDASLLSYHGGKNNITVQRGWYTGVSSLDISSAYPDAMRQLPAMSNAKLYKRFRGNVRLKNVPDLGVYSVSGNVKQCDWPSLYSHGFKPLSGKIDRVWVQGYEVNEALRSKELTLSSIRGFYYDAEKDHQAPGLRYFVDTFYELKQREKDPVLRYMYKLILNSISGKFIQTNKKNSGLYTDLDASDDGAITVNASELTAGGMFHPFIASAITAHTRARIHRLEHKYKALHTATDGILTQQANVKQEGSGLGALEVEHKNATLMLVRNKCYILYVKKPTPKTFPSTIHKPWHIAKTATHGFQGRIWQLEKLMASGKRKYKASRPNKLKESMRRGLQVNDFVEREYILKVGPLEVNPKKKKRRV